MQGRPVQSRQRTDGLAKDKCHVRHMDEYSHSPSADPVHTGRTSERLYILTEAAPPEPQHIQRLEAQDIKKTESIELMVGTHMARFVLDSGARCNIMCASEYEKMEPKPELSSCRVNVYK